ncbi:hypothetical protein KCP73_06390 [Salmonella enterica subsp. enterica]|nr:hypothetical protein KCP73_06390 [Salmonella enterica subsp. enterica]
MITIWRCVCSELPAALATLANTILTARAENQAMSQAATGLATPMATVGALSRR